MSSNPFRKKAPTTIDTVRTSSPKSSLRSEDPLASADRKSKPVKRVRVLSPPPLSPDSPAWKFDGPQQPATFPDDTFSYTNYHPSFDPFSGTSTDESDRDSTPTPPPLLPQTQRLTHPHQDGHITNYVPANPFSKTLDDTEASAELQKERKEEGEVLKAANAGKKALNVDAFRNLLMTGSAVTETSLPTRDDEFAARNGEFVAPAPELGATPKLTYNRREDSSAESSESQGQDDDDDVSKSSSSRQTDKERKLPPPPPSSRHGKSLRQQAPTDSPQEGQDTVPGPGTKNQPATPRRRSLDENPPPNRDNDIIPPAEGQTETPGRRPNASKKSAPAPPPSRGHSRTDSKATDVEGHRRTSGESLRSRSDSTRSSSHVPAPPPPRRPPITSKQTNQPSTPNVTSSSTTHTPTSPDQAEFETPPSPGNAIHTAGKLSAPPPPPPARHSSTRRPPSLNNVDAASRRVSSESKSREGLAPPPPPPPRNRSGSGNNAASLKKPSEEAELTADSGKSADILADLDALQREVDALRGKMN